MSKPIHFYAIAIALSLTGAALSVNGASLMGALLVLCGLLACFLAISQSISLWSKADEQRLRDVSESNRLTHHNRA